jgi:ribosomal protein S18 acetylase RimI-like enzyme
MLSLTLRPMNEEDIDAVSSLAEKVWRTHYPEIISNEQIEYLLAQQYSKESLRQQLADKQQFFLAYNNKELAGFISIIDEGDEHYFIRKLYVDQTQARNGIGAALLTKVEQSYPNWRSFTLRVNRKNWKAINFYFRTGFTIAMVEDIDCGGGYFMNDFRMVKRLAR